MMSTLNVNTINDVNGNNRPQECKAWVNFNGTAAIVINDSFNVDSLVDNGTGNYEVIFTTDFANTDYCAASSTMEGSNVMAKHTSLSIGSCDVMYFLLNGTTADISIASAMFFGDQ